MSIDQVMSDFDQMQSPEARIELNLIVQAKKIPNALLFTGPLHSGRKEAAFWFAKGCNCKDPVRPGCGQCRPCLKIDAGTHPDILAIEPETGKKAILISQIRQLATRIASKPNEAAYRMVLISDAHMMNIQAQNALLKMLEEPPENTFFVLVEEKPGVLLPTIISRCRRIRFSAMTLQQIEQILCNKYGTAPTQAGIAARTADRDLKKALLYLNLAGEEHATDWIEKRKWLISSLFDMLVPLPNCPAPVQQALSLSWQLNLESTTRDDSIAVIKTFFRDLLIFFYDPQKIVNLDFFDKFKDISQKVPKKLVFKWLSLLFETEHKLTQNCSVKLTLDSFFLQIVQGMGKTKVKGISHI